MPADRARGTTVYYFPFRIGSFTNQPKYFGRMNGTRGMLQAFVENRFNQSPEPINLIWFGLNHSGNVNGSFGLHVYNHPAGWSLWTPAAFPGTQRLRPTDPVGIPNPLVIIPSRDWDAFQVRD